EIRVFFPELVDEGDRVGQAAALVGGAAAGDQLAGGARREDERDTIRCGCRCEAGCGVWDWGDGRGRGCLTTSSRDQDASDQELAHGELISARIRNAIGIWS